ncbi:hypothetical protein [uncultured Ferrovibrio sp.]|jgi:hypothetical protein|uniref:hypothetical protein n=1 Tax=uncultured Ferrovibrio sp. TaxID=1576913 RepID=UPI002618415B|nr:hypothetical protein [uncultured Ferrovibrio sp.]
MPVRLGAAAAMAAILATLVVLIVRAIIDPPVVPNIASREAFLFQMIGIGCVAGLVYQLIFLWLGVPSYRGGLAWGLGGFAAAVLAPLLSLPDQPAGVMPAGDGGALLFWSFVVAVSGAGLMLLLLGRGRQRLFGLALLLAPPLVAPASTWREQTGYAETPPGDVSGMLTVDPLSSGSASLDPLPDIPLEAATGGDTVLMLGLNLLFWLLLGVFSVLANRRVVQRRP